MNYELMEEEEEHVDNIHQEAVVLKEKIGLINTELDRQNR